FEAINPNAKNLQRLFLLYGRGPASAPAEQIDLRAHLAEWVARGVDAIDPRDGIEDDFAPLRLPVVHADRQGDGAEGDLRAALRPGHAGVSHVVAVAGQLHEDAQPDRSSCQPRADLVEEEVRGLRGGLLVREVLGAFFGPDAESPVPAEPLGVGELEGSYGEERLPRKAGRDRLGRLDEALRAGVRREEGAERLGLARPEGGRGAEELQELLAGADRKAVRGVSDDVGVDVIGQVEAHGDPAG